MKRFFYALVLFLAVYCNYTTAQNVTQFRGQHRDGIYNEKGLIRQWPAEGPKVLWTFEELGKGFSSVIVVDGKIYTTGMLDSTGYLFCLDLNGKLLWKTSYGLEWYESFPGTRTTPTFSEGKLYINNGFGTAVCFEANSGKILWKTDLVKEYKAQHPRWGIAESPLIVGDKVILSVGSDVATLVALDKNTGKLIWKSKANTEVSAYCSPAYYEYNGKKMIVTLTSGNVLGINANDGSFMWSFPKVNKYGIHPNTPLFKDDMIYVVSGYGSGGIMLKLNADASAVTQVWANTTLDNQMGGVIYLNGYIYGSGHDNKSWQCLDWNTGNVNYTSTEIGKGVIIYADGLLYFYSDKGELALVKGNAANFEVLSKTTVTKGSEAHWAHPVICNGVLYVRHGNALIAYGIK